MRGEGRFQQLAESEEGARGLDFGTEFLRFLVSFIDVYFRVYLYQLVLDVSSNEWVSFWAWLAVILVSDPLTRCFVAREWLPPRGKLLVLVGLSVAAQYGLYLFPEQNMRFFMFIVLDQTAAIFCEMLSLALARTRHNPLHVIELDHIGSLIAFILTFYLVLNEEDAADRFNPTMLKVSAVQTLLLLLLLVVYRPLSSAPAPEPKPGRGLDYLAALSLMTSRFTTIFYAANWISEYYKKRKLGTNVYSSTVLAMCLLYILVDMLVLLLVRLPQSLLHRLIYVLGLVSCASLLYLGLGKGSYLFYEAYFLDDNLPYLFLPLFLSLLWGELVSVGFEGLVGESVCHEREMQQVSFLLLFGTLPLLKLHPVTNMAVGGASGLLGLVLLLIC